MRSASEYVGGVPLVVRIAEDDVLHATERPAPAAFVLPRTTMLIALVRDLLVLFRPYAAALHPESTQVWFSVGDTPVPWLYPAGAVKDYVNECTREDRLARLSSTAASPNTLQGSAAAGASSSTLVQSLLCSVPSEPLYLTFHIHSLTKGSVLARTVPLYVNYDRLEEHIRMEIKQAHKAAYTCLYGNYTHYQREAESTLLPAIGLALYRPFDEATQQELQQQREQEYSGGGVGRSSAPTASRVRYQNPTTDFSSPFLLMQYQQLLQGVLSPRPHVAYLLRVGFPFAYRGASSRFEGGYLQYDCHRVSAAPTLAWVPSSPGLAEDPTTAAAAVVTSSNRDGAVVEADQLSFGLLLWRLFRIAVLRWQLKQASNNITASAAPLTEVQLTYQQLLRSLAPFYADPPASATDHLEEQEPLLTGTPAEPPAWAAWESEMAHTLEQAYEEESGEEKKGLPLIEDGSAAAAQQPQRRLRFMVQGIQPSLKTPASFLEAHLASSDRALFVTVQLAAAATH